MYKTGIVDGGGFRFVSHLLNARSFNGRRYTGNMNGERYLANTSPSKLEVHDLDNENANCQMLVPDFQRVL